jgi:hypothetical protein
MKYPRLVEITYIESNFSINSDCSPNYVDGFTLVAELNSEDEAFMIRWDGKNEQFIIDKKDEKGKWQKSGFITYHQKKIDSEDKIYSVTLGDYNGKMIFKGIFKI